MQISLKRIIPFGIFILMVFLSHFKTWNDLPRGLHAWGQSDRYAISQRYTETGMDIFTVSTFNMASENGRTGAELPLSQYIAASLAQLGLQPYLPFLNKLINLLIFSLGFFAFVRSFKIDDVWLQSVLIVLVMSSPVLMFYAYNFLPDAAGLGFVLYGYALLLRYRDNQAMRWIYIMLAVGTLGALIKLSTAIYLMANLLFVAIALLRTKSWKKLSTLLVGGIASAVIIGAYVQYGMIAVNERFWSVVFRAHANPISSISDFSDVILGMAYWRTEYLSILTSIVVLLLLIVLIVKIVKKQIVLRWDGMLFHTLIVCLGLFLFIMVLGKQFVHHDYYIIATFLPLIFMGIYWFAKHGLPKVNIHPGLLRLLITLPAILYFYSTPSKNHRRLGDPYKMRKHVVHNYTNNLNGASEASIKAGIAEDDLIFVMYTEAPNLPLVYFNRKGMCFNAEELARKEPFVEYWLRKLEPAFIICPGSTFKEFERDQNDLLENLKPIQVEGDFIILKRKQPWHEYLPPEE